MFDRKPSALIKDILNCINKIGLYTKGFSSETFSANYMVVEACLYNLQVIGEAVSKLPDDIKKTEANIPWNLIKGMRNRLIHEYFGTDPDIVWRVIKNELPAMMKELEEINQRLVKGSR
jgi:uncharacterized protein with HEPN domain